MIDPRATAAAFYDLEPDLPEDVPFYRAALPRADAHVLELGCGTGRVLTALAADCGYIHGVDSSAAMLAVCQRRLRQSGIGRERARVHLGDITEVDLGREFDLIIAPYRVFQNLETDAQVDAFFRRARAHLAARGALILDVFNPNRDAETLRREWCVPDEIFCWEVFRENRRITCHERRPRLSAQPLVLYPELIHRVFQAGELVEESLLRFPMRCYYPEELIRLVEGLGFRVTDRWGGYHGERYGSGPELLLRVETVDRGGETG